MDSDLLNYFRNANRCEKIKSDLIELDTSKTYLGTTKATSNLRTLLSHNYFRGLATSKDFEKVNLNVDSITAVGGWCAVRTNDMNKIKNGLVVNPSTGELMKITKVNDVTEWIKKSISLDQIVESVGSFTGDKYVIMSERQLWSTKLENVLQKLFNRSLSQKESQSIYDAIKYSEKRRHIITKRYLDYVNQKKNSVEVIIDEDHIEEIEQNKNKLMFKYNISIEDLVESILKGKNGSDSDIRKEKKEIEEYVKEYTKVWYFFTKDYSENILKKHEYVTTEQVALINSWQYSVNYEIKIEQILNKYVLNNEIGKLNNYTKNMDHFFVAYLSAEDYSFKQYKTHLLISDIPNTINYINYSLALSDHYNKLNYTYLTDDKFLQDMFNFCQDFESTEILQQIVSESTEFSKLRNSIKGPDNNKKLKLVAEVRKMKLAIIQPKLNEQVIRYKNLLKMLFE